MRTWVNRQITAILYCLGFVVGYTLSPLWNQRGEVKVGDPPADPPPAAPPKEPDALSMDDLKGIIKTAIVDATKEGGSVREAMNSLKTEMTEVNRKAFFPAVDGLFGEGEAETFGGSIIDTSCFHKAAGAVRGAIAANPQMGVLQQGMILGRELARIGGPFKKLSPEMEVFAKQLKCRGQVTRMIANGIDMPKQNETILEHLKQLTGVNYKQAGMSEGVLADGGALVPVEYPATVIEFAFTQSPILSKVWRMPMSTNVMRIPRLVQAAGSYFGGITFYSPGEGEEKHSSKPQFERLSFEARKRIGLVYLTDELIADSLINIVNYVTGLYVRGFMYDMEALVLNNTAAAQAAGTPCLGIINDPNVIANGVARNTAGTINYTDLNNLDGQLDENFRNLCWMTRKKTLSTLRNERDLNNHPIVQDQFLHSPGTVQTSMFGYPVYLTRNCPAMGQMGDIVLGDLSFYLLAIRQDLAIDTSEHVRFIYDEQTLRFVARYDGMPVVPIAFTELVSES